MSSPARCTGSMWPFTEAGLWDSSAPAPGMSWSWRARSSLRGSVDGHVHIESSMVSVPEYARAVVPRGTTTVVADPHELANVWGEAGIRLAS